MKTEPGNLSRLEVLQELRKLGTEQNRKVYRRHGVTTEMCGVSFANLEKLKKRIKVNHTLALELWQTRNHDAQILATMVADPARVDEVLLESWVKDLENYVLTDALIKLVCQTNLAGSWMEQWTRSDDEWVGRAGWGLLSSLALQDTDLPDSYFKPFLKVIEREIHDRKNRVRDAMNSALIAIGIRNSNLQQQALAIAAKIGKVTVDHGETSCKTPDAAAYILKTVESKRARKIRVCS